MASAFPNDDRKRHSTALMVVLDIFPQIMRDMICNNFPPNIVLVLIQNDPTFETNLHSMEKKMISNIRTNGYNSLDISLFYKIIRYFKLLPIPNQGWGKKPESGDIKQEDDVERMKNLRNDVIHRPAGGLSELEISDFFRKSIEIAKRMDNIIGCPNNGFESKIEEIQSYTVTNEKYIKLLEKCVEFQARLQEMAGAPSFDLFYGNDIKIIIDAQGDHLASGGRTLACTLCLKDPDFDVNAVIQMLAVIQEYLSRGNFEVSLVDAASSSLILHVTMQDTCFMTKDNLHKTVQTFLHAFFIGASIPFTLDHIYTVVLEESEYLDKAKKNDSDYLKDTLPYALLNVLNRHNVPLKGSAREVFTIADSDSPKDPSSSSRAVQDSKLRVMSMGSAEKDMNDIERHSSALMVIVDIVPQMMREMICNIWPPKVVLKMIQNDKHHTRMNNLTPLEQKMILEMDRNSYNNLDISCLYKLIRHYNLLPPPKQGWGNKPKVDDQSEGDDVERMKLLRNDIIHRPHGSLSESERNCFFQQIIEIAKRLDKRIGSHSDGFESKIETVRSTRSSKEKYIEALEKITEYQARLQETATAPCFDLYYGNEIQIKIDNQDCKSRDDIGRTTLYLRDPDFDVTAVIEMLDEIKKRLKDGNMDISLEEAEIGSLNLHVIIPDRCFMTNQILHESIQSFLLSFFLAGSIPSIQGKIYTVVLGESDYSVADKETKDVLDYQNENILPDFRLNVKMKDSTFQNEFVLCQ